MVFVTHDVNIKNFAHRVVRMRDGKVAQIEEIAPHLREQAIRQLDDELGVRTFHPVSSRAHACRSVSADQDAGRRD
jgi:ABC-type sulfate/molybdate transport systems ATPase subunit